MSNNVDDDDDGVIIIIWYLANSFSPKYLKHFIGIALLFLTIPPWREGENRDLISISLRGEAETQSNERAAPRSPEETGLRLGEEPRARNGCLRAPSHPPHGRMSH